MLWIWLRLCASIQMTYCPTKILHFTLLIWWVKTMKLGVIVAETSLLFFCNKIWTDCELWIYSCPSLGGSTIFSVKTYIREMRMGYHYTFHFVFTEGVQKSRMSQNHWILSLRRMSTSCGCRLTHFICNLPKAMPPHNCSVYMSDDKWLSLSLILLQYAAKSVLIYAKIMFLCFGNSYL
jgi:hypothetical protein